MGEKEAIIKKIGDAVEQQIIGFKEQIFKAYWRYQLRIDKFYERKCRKCQFVSYCFTEGLLLDCSIAFNLSNIQAFCKNKRIIETVKSLKDLIEKYGCQPYNLSDELQNKWFKEVKEGENKKWWKKK